MTKREDNPNSAEFRLQPLERGYGYTFGHGLDDLSPEMMLGLPCVLPMRVVYTEPHGSV